MEFQLRDKIDNQYRVTEKHFGGMSVVYIVLDEFSQRRFAVKTLKQELLEDRNASSRFSAEARTWMNLGRHPNIVEAIIYREIEGQPFLFLEYVEGADLQVLIDVERYLFPPQLTAFMLQVCAGMSYVHNAAMGPGGDVGVIHRDIKPANIMLTRQAVVKITDFGLAKTYGMATDHTDIGVGLGTYLYMPPEQLLDASSADKTSDIYSFGIAFYTALTGHTPIGGKNVGQIVRNILNQEPIRPSQLVAGVPQELEDIILRCIAKPREQRFQSFEEVQEALLEAQESIQEAHRDRDDVRRCRGCGYMSVYHHHACPICANTFEAIAYPPPEPKSATVNDTAEAAPGPRAETDDPEQEALNVLLQAARSWRAKDDLPRALNLLRQALALAPGHVEARREHDEITLELARRKPRGPARSYNWPMFRGNITRTGYTPDQVIPPLSRRWQYSVGDWILASPVVSNGLVFVGGRQSRPALQGRFVALEAERGQLAWELEMAHEFVLSPCVMGGNLLFVPCHNMLLALEARTGRRLWETMTQNPITCSPVAWQNMVCFGTEQGALHAVNAHSGQRIWSFQAEMGIYSSPLIWEGKIYFGSGDHRLYAIDQMDGKLQWEFMSANEISATPLFHRGRIYVGSADHRLYCLDCQSGRRVWEFQAGGPVNSSAAAKQDTVYFGSRDHNLYAVTADTGAHKWHFTAGDWINSSPAISERTVFIGSHDKKIYGVEAETGILLWEYQTDGEVTSSPALSGGRLFVGSNDGNLYCFKSS